MNILFVCSGNTCRSPMAEGYLNALCLENTTAKSCGFCLGGDSANKNSIEAMCELGIDISGHKSRAINGYLCDEADKIYCMTDEHLLALKNAGIDESKLFVLGGGIPDPFGGDLNTYRTCRESIKNAIDDLFLKDDIKIVPLNEKNALDIARLEKICFSQPWSLEVILDSFKHGTKYFVAVKGDKTLGYCGLNSVLDEGYITNIAVFPEYRKQGIGRVILARVLDYAIKNSLSFVSLEVRESNTSAQRLYSKFGFKNEGLRKNFYKDPSENALIMTRRFTNEDT